MSEKNITISLPPIKLTKNLELWHTVHYQKSTIVIRDNTQRVCKKFTDP